MKIGEVNEIQIFIRNIKINKELLEKSQNFEEDLQKFIHKNIMINLVSTLEGFFKFYFEKMIKDWNFSLEKLANSKKVKEKKLNIADLVHFQDKDIHLSEIVSQLFNFQDLNDIETIFRNLLDLDHSIFEILKDFYNRNLKIGINQIENLYPKLQEIIKLRHTIVHDVFFEFISEKNLILDYISFILNFIVGFADFLAEITLERKNERGIMHLGFLKWDLNEYDAAIECFEKTIEIEPEFPGYHFSLGILYQIQGNPQKAIYHLKFFVDKNPEAFDGWLYLAESFLSAEDFEGAIEAYNKVLEKDPNDIRSLNNLTFSYYSLKRYKEAINIVEKAVKIDNKNVLGFWLLGTIKFEIGNYTEALEAINIGLDLVPDDICFICYKGRILMETNKIENAISILEKLISLKPIKICVFKYLAEAYNLKGDSEKSISILKEGLKLAKRADDKEELIKIQKKIKNLQI